LGRGRTGEEGRKRKEKGGKGRDRKGEGKGMGREGKAKGRGEEGKKGGTAPRALLRHHRHKILKPPLM